MLWSMQLELPDSPDVLKRMRANKIRDRSISLGRRDSYATRWMSPPPLPVHSSHFPFGQSPCPSSLPSPSLFTPHYSPLSLSVLPPLQFLLAPPFPPIRFSLPFSFPFSFPFPLFTLFYLHPAFFLYLHYHNDKGCLSSSPLDLLMKV